MNAHYFNFNRTTPFDQVSDQTRRNIIASVRQDMNLIKQLNTFDNANTIDNRLFDQRLDAAWVISALRDGVATAALPKEELAFAQWLLQANPHLATDLNLKIEPATSDNQGAAGQYNGLTRVITLFAGKLDQSPGAVVHEILHHTERMMPKAVQKGIFKAWQKAWNTAWRESNGDEKLALGNMLMASLGDKQAHAKMLSHFESGVLDYDRHYQLHSPSEYWAVNATQLLNDRFVSRQLSWVMQAKQWLSELVEHVKHWLGQASNQAIIEGLNAVIQSQGKPQSDTMLTQSNTHHVFAGIKAKQADLQRLQTAIVLSENQVNAEQIRQQTGWFQGVDQQWRFEISDEDARLACHPDLPIGVLAERRKNSLMLAGGEPLQLKHLFWHSALFKAYPEMADLEIRVTWVNGFRGRFCRYKNNGSQWIDIDQALTAQEATETLLHEIQHVIQSIEGFTNGSHPGMFHDKDLTEVRRKVIDDAIQALMTNNPEWAVLYRQKNRLFNQIQAKYGTDSPKGRRLDWYQVPDEMSSVYFNLLDQLREHSVNDTCFDLEMERHNVLSQHNIITADEQYRRSAGEVEARNVQARQNLTEAERRATPINQTQDVPDEQLIRVEQELDYQLQS